MPGGSARFSYRATLRHTFGIALAISVLLTAYNYLDDVARDQPSTLWIRIVEEFTGVMGGWLLLPGVVWWARQHRPLQFGAHALGALVFSIVHTTSNYVSRVVLFPLAGLGAYDYGHLPVRYLMEAGHDIFLYGLIVAITFLFDRYQESQQRELALARANLENLRLQLQPHFLFNALNSISAVMFEDPKKADTMLTRLADLLRFSLRETPGQEVPLRSEMQALDLYLEIARLRFGQRLRIATDVPPDTIDCLVPQLILQPLMENAIRHGADPSTGEIDVTLRARRENGQLHLEIEDHGPGPALPVKPRVGLANTTRRLESLYGSRQRFALTASPQGGAIAAVSLPVNLVSPGSA